MLLILPITESRAAWLGASLGLLVVINNRYCLLHRFRAMLHQSAMKAIAITLASLLVGGILTTLFYIRPASALGRLLTWKVSGRIILDHPLLGIGYDQFFAYFGRYQAAYFARFPESPLSSLAGQGEYAFNTFIEITVEQGFIGLGLFIILIVVALRTAFLSQSTLMAAAGASLLAILIFGLFSYPFSIMPIQLNFIFLLALLSAKQSVAIRWSMPSVFLRCVAIPGLLLLLFYLSYYDIIRYQAYQQWKIASAHKDFFNYEEAIAIYSQIHPILQDNGKFLFQYGQTLSYEGEHRQAITVLEQAKQRTTDTYLYTCLGDSYQALKQYEKAEECFQFAINHNPYRFYPRSLLAHLYEETGKKSEAVKVARKVISMDIKVPSESVDTIRREMQTLIIRLDSIL